MNEEILVNVSSFEVRVAVVEAGVLQEIIIERADHRDLVGSIILAKVTRVLPGIQAAFVDIGQERAAFLPQSEIVRAEESASDDMERAPNSIANLLHEGQLLLVQVTKGLVDSKGARLTTNLSLPSRYLVYLPQTNRVGVSVRIQDDSERERLKALLETLCADKPGGFIIRTNAQGVGEDALRTDMALLYQLWDDIKARASNAATGTCVYDDLSITKRLVRDCVNSDSTMRIDSKPVFEETRVFAQRFFPSLVSQIQYYNEAQSIFDLYHIDEQIQKNLDKTIHLASGGAIVIEKTEAMITIDVNTASFVGHNNFNKTILQTNLEAAHAIASALRLRNIGGIIVVDFIDMNNEDDQNFLQTTLRQALDKDRAKTTMSELSSLGLIEITRKRTRKSLQQLLCEPCPTCFGQGMIKSVQTICYEILREISRQAQRFEGNFFLVTACEAVIERLTLEQSICMSQCDQSIFQKMKLQVEPLYTQGQYDVVMIE